MLKNLSAIVLATTLLVGCNTPPPPVQEEHTHVLYEEQLRTLDEQYQLLFEDVAQLRKELEDKGTNVNPVGDPYRHERIVERIGQLECAVWAKKPCGVLK